MDMSAKAFINIKLPILIEFLLEAHVFLNHALAFDQHRDEYIN